MGFEEIKAFVELLQQDLRKKRDLLISRAKLHSLTWIYVGGELWAPSMLLAIHTLWIFSWF